jgi:hypothetical protein
MIFAENNAMPRKGGVLLCSCVIYGPALFRAVGSFSGNKAPAEWIGGVSQYLR